MPVYSFVGTVGIRKDGATPNLISVDVNATSGTELVAQIVAAIDAAIAPLQPQLDDLNAAKTAALA